MQCIDSQRKVVKIIGCPPVIGLVTPYITKRDGQTTYKLLNGLDASVFVNINWLSTTLKYTILRALV